MRIRCITTGSGKHAIQVVSKIRGKYIIHRHFGSFVNDEKKQLLYKQAENYIEETSGQKSLFDPVIPGLDLANVAILKSQPLFIYNFLKRVYHKIGFDQYCDEVIRDLVIARIHQPASKLATQEILADLFDRQYLIKTLYRHLKNALSKNLKEIFQEALVKTARSELNDDLSLLFYDVTTLAFDSQTRTILKNLGFSKSHRHHDPQIVVGLVVNRLGFPIYFDVFPGNTFEGHTFIQVVKRIGLYLKTDKLVVVADAAMLSKENMTALISRGISFIVGARLSNLPKELTQALTQTLPKTDGAVQTYPYQAYRLICHYSQKRAGKDRTDREKQLARAKGILQKPDLLTRRYRFIQKDQGAYSLNQKLLIQAEQMEGIKGYLTNTDLPESLVISRYHDLWRIEQDFKVTKSDLEARPIFHQLDDTIKAHLVIVFAALAIHRYVEIKSGLTVKQVLKIGGKVLTHTAVNEQTHQRKLIVTKITNPDILSKIALLNSIGY